MCSFRGSPTWTCLLSLRRFEDGLGLAQWKIEFAARSQKWVFAWCQKLNALPPGQKIHLLRKWFFFASDQAGGVGIWANQVVVLMPWHGHQGCIHCLTCSHPELTQDKVLTSAYVIIFCTVATNALNKSVWRKKDCSWLPSNKHAINIVI